MHVRSFTINFHHFHSSKTEQKRFKMSRNYDNWERLVAAVLKRELLWELFHAHSRTPSVLSEASSDFSSVSELEDVSLGSVVSLIKSKNLYTVFVSRYEPVFDFDNLVRASAEILGKGTFGSVYSAKLENGTYTVAVRRLKNVNISEQEFITHMNTVRDVKHQNVAELRAYIYSEDEKLMIYDYYHGGSVSALLHGKPSGNPAKVAWIVRLRIAIGAARGINHIHTQHLGTMVHGNIKSSNIFLDYRQYVVVSDLGLASMISTTFAQSSRCYAPEVESTGAVSQETDVYSFGILLLELLTRKSHDLSLGHDAMDLAQLVDSANRMEWTKVFDGDLLLNPSIRDQIMRTLEIGISCVVKSPKNRPKMLEVLNLIEDIDMMNMGQHSVINSDSTMDTGNRSSTQTEMKELYLCHGNPTFDLEDLVKASYKILGNGTFGTSYEVTLETGIIVCMKRLKNVVVTNVEFQRHMEVVGRMGHENITEIRAYHYSMNEQLLVYDYYHEGGLSTMLHGNRDSGTTLNWDARLKIAVGAARGIAHIHTKNKQTLVHGNIRASNIFCNKQQYGMVSDVGLAKLTSIVIGSEGYCAPEATNYTKVAQASDVYNFGVVLLEILSGQPSETTYRGKVMSLVQKTKMALREELASRVLDEELWRYGGVDTDMLQLMQIAMRCIANKWYARPKMVDVVSMLEKLRF